jgi:hypothetical protein
MLFCGPLSINAEEGFEPHMLPFIVDDLHAAYKMSDRSMGFLPAYQRNKPKNTGIE